MGTVLNFPATLRTGRPAKSVLATSESAIIIILPVIRIERHPGAPENSVQSSVGSSARRRRRSRATR